MAGLLSAWNVNFEAGTHPADTCYGLAATGGDATFLPALVSALDALLHPDYTDEEVRREVHHFDVAVGAGGKRELLEIGSVYNEMVRTSAMPFYPPWRAMRAALYGEHHPLAFEAGGEPDAIGDLTPESIARFHRDHYRLANMRLIVAVPPSMKTASVLATLREVAAREPGATATGFAPTKPLPPRSTAAPGTVRVLPYPSEDAAASGLAIVTFPPDDDASVTRVLATRIALQELADGPSSRLARRLDDLRAAGRGFGSPALETEMLEMPGRPATVWLTNVLGTAVTEARMGELRDLVRAEVVALTAVTDRSEIEALRERLLARVVEHRRTLVEALESPPKLDERAANLSWNYKLDDAFREPGGDKSLLFEDAVASVEARLRAPGNPFANLTRGLPLGTAAPLVMASRPSVELHRSIDAAAEKRKLAEIQRLMSVTGASSRDDALARLAVERAAGAKVLEESAVHDPKAPPPPALPMTLDDGITYSERRVGEMPVVDVPFETMSAASIGVAISLDRVPTDLLPYLSLLPDFFLKAGIREAGAAIGSEEVASRLRRDVRSVDIAYGADARGAPSLRVVASGLGEGEARAALAWSRRLLENADWDLKNVERLRALAEAAEERGLGQTADPEEQWLPLVRQAVGYRSDAALVHVYASFASAEDDHRIGWMLASPGGAQADSLRDGLRAVTIALGPLSRAEMVTMLRRLAEGDVSSAPAVAKAVRASRDPAEAMAAVRRAGRGLGRRVADLPESSRRADVLAYLERATRAVSAGAPAALREMSRLRDLLVHESSARAWAVTSSAQHASLRGDVDAYLRRFADHVAAPAPRAAFDIVDARARERGASIEGHPLGLVLPAMSSGAVTTSVPAPSYLDVSDSAVLDSLAMHLFSGGASTSFWSRTSAAGLAYSNGSRPILASGRDQYYAERCPDLGATLAFVTDIVQKAADVSPLLESAAAETFYSRTAERLDVRASAMANDLAIGVTPTRVRAFHEKVLALRNRRDLAKEIGARRIAAHADIIPGLDPDRNGAEHGLQLFFGPEPILAAVDSYLRERTKNRVSVTRIYPRDFWDDGTRPAAPSRR